MQKSLIEHYMTKVAEGDVSYLQRLCYQLSDRLIYIPAIQINKSYETTKVEVVKLNEAAASFVPVFTSEKRYRMWKEGRTQPTDSISLLGGDLCVVLGMETGVIIDPGAENSVRLEAELVARIGEEALNSEQDFDDCAPDSELHGSMENIDDQHNQPVSDHVVQSWAEVQDVAAAVMTRNGHEHNGVHLNDTANGLEPQATHSFVVNENVVVENNDIPHHSNGNGSAPASAAESAPFVEEAARIAFSGNNAVEMVPAAEASQQKPEEAAPVKKKRSFFRLFSRK